MMQSSLVAQTAFEIGAILAKLTPVERTVTLGTAFAEALNEAVPHHLHQAHLQLLTHCATAATNGAAQSRKAAAIGALQSIVAAAASIDAELQAEEAAHVHATDLPDTALQRVKIPGL